MSPWIWLWTSLVLAASPNADAYYYYNYLMLFKHGSLSDGLLFKWPCKFLLTDIKLIYYIPIFQIYPPIKNKVREERYFRQWCHAEEGNHNIRVMQRLHRKRAVWLTWVTSCKMGCHFGNRHLNCKWPAIIETSSSFYFISRFYLLQRTLIRNIKITYFQFWLLLNLSFSCDVVPGSRVKQRYIFSIILMKSSFSMTLAFLRRIKKKYWSGFAICKMFVSRKMSQH